MFLNYAAVVVCGMSAVYFAAQGNVVWTMINAIFCILNIAAIFALRDAEKK